MKAETMTSRERILATIHGKPVDRYPVWLKMTNATWRRGQPDDVQEMDDLALLEAAGCDRMLGAGLGARGETPHVTYSTTQEAGVRTERWVTPAGTLSAVSQLDPATASWHPTGYPVGSRGELECLQWVFRDTTYAPDPGRVAAHRRRQQEVEALDAVSISGTGPGPLMDMVEHWCGPEQATFLLFDHPDLFTETLQLMHEDRLRRLKATLPLTEADTFWLTENTSTTLISPSMFEQLCVPHLVDYGNLILENDLIPVHHMCGTLNALLEMIDGLPAMANEAFTTAPVGDCSLAEGRSRMPSKALIGGTNAALWMRDADTIIETVAADLAACPDRSKIFLTSAGVLPPVCDLDKARAVVDGFKALPV